MLALRPRRRKACLAAFLGKDQLQPPLTPNQKATAEITLYLQEMALDGDETPLTGWKNNQGRFPLMARLARKYLCICATSAPSEHVFSPAGSVATPLRSLLNPEKVNMLVFLARNLDI